MIASLGMYDFGPLQGANDRLWALIRDGLRAHGIDAPDLLTRGEGAYWQAWEAADLVLSQTCGYPFRTRLHGKVTYICTPDFGVKGCPPGYYRSIFVARANDSRQTLADFDGASFAYNEPQSQSGWAAPQNHVAAKGLHLLPTLQTGAHRLSAQAVAEGRADIAALDAVTYALLQKVEPAIAVLKEIGWTEPTPGLPYISAPGQDAEVYFTVVSQAFAALAPTDRATLGLRGIVRIPAASYLAVPNPPAPEQIARPI
jgi:ABC-type phosphate/phosphonate transport system substrate-binding protein